MVSIKSALPTAGPLFLASILTARARTHILVSLLLSSGALSNAAHAVDSGGADWTTFGGRVEGISYSKLSDIKPSNVASLKEEFSLPTGVYGSHNGGPLVINDPVAKTTTLYVVTPFPNYLEAYDLKTGQLKWVYKPEESKFARGVNCCDTTNHGAAYYNGKIVYNLLDNHVVAVDAKTGKQLWKSVSLADPHTGVTMTGAPLIVPDKANPTLKQRVIVGSSNGEMGVRGWVKGLDLATGKLEWTAYTTGPDADVRINVNPKIPFKPFYPKDQGTDAGKTSWPTGPNAGVDKYKPTYLHGGSSVWSWLTYDPETDLVFYGTGQPGVWNPDMRCAPEQLADNPHACDNKWGASIFARKPTGEAVWAYQMVPHDNWDFDSTSESMVINKPITVDGVTHDKLLVNFHKNGFAYVFDRTTGQILSAPPFTHVNWATHVDLNTGEPQVVDAFRVHQGEYSEIYCPSPLGGKPWLPGAYSPDSGLVFVPTMNLCQSLKGLKTEFIAGSPYMGQAGHGALGPLTDNGNPFISELVAWDLSKKGADGQYGVKAWGIPEKSAIWGGVLATAGGLVFYGTQDKVFKAVDVNTHQVVFSTTLECSTVGNPISFKGPDGKQRIAVFSGVGRLAGLIGGGGSCPANNKLEDGWDVSHPTDPSRGGRVHVYKLSL